MHIRRSHRQGGRRKGVQGQRSGIPGRGGVLEEGTHMLGAERPGAGRSAVHSTEILDLKVRCFQVRKGRQFPVRSGQHRTMHKVGRTSEPSEVPIESNHRRWPKGRCTLAVILREDCKHRSSAPERLGPGIHCTTLGTTGSCLQLITVKKLIFLHKCHWRNIHALSAHRNLAALTVHMQAFLFACFFLVE